MTKNLLITGSTGNLGTAVVDYLHQKGYQLIGTTRSRSASNKNIDLYECDLTDEKSVSECFSRIKSNYDQLYGAVLLAGGFDMGDIHSSGREDILKMFNLNFMSAYLTSRECIKWMNEADGGRIIFTGAKPALEGGGTFALPYTLSKSSVMELANLINSDSSLKNIQASVIVPSIIDTPPNRTAMPDSDFSDWVTPEAIAENIEYLLSAKAQTLRSTVLKLYNNA